MPERLVVVWRVTTRCNLSCAFCAYDRRLAIPRVDADVGLIMRMGPAFARWSETTGRPLLVSWIGGEPLLWPPLEGLTRHYRALGLKLSTTTNGMPLSRIATREHIVENYAELTVSVDAPGTSHDNLRGRVGLFDHVRRDVKLIAVESAGSGLLLRANVVLMRENIAGFPALCRELATWGIREITCNQLGGRDRPGFFQEHRLLPRQIARLRHLWPELRQSLEAEGVRLSGDESYLDRMAASARGIPMAVADCGPGRRYLFIDENGRVSPCSFTTDEYGVPIENEDIGALPVRFTEQRDFHPCAQCRDCQCTQHFGKFTQP